MMLEHEVNNTKPYQPDQVGHLPNPFGKYQVVRELGRGGMGCVYEAMDVKLERRVALKIPHPHLMVGDTLTRFEREARMLARISHHHICTIHEFDCVGEIHFLAMAFVEGTTLAQHVRDRPRPADIAIILQKCARALNEAHKHGVIHRDLKPANIMLNKYGEPIIMDFGLARSHQEETITQTGALLGTVAYMPLEQMERGHGAVGPRSDIYSLGAVMYELLCGRPPFRGAFMEVIGKRLTREPRPPSAHREGVDKGLEAICLKAMARLPEDRYPTMEVFADALQHWRDNMGSVMTLDPATHSASKESPSAGRNATQAPKPPTTTTNEHFNLSTDSRETTLPLPETMAMPKRELPNYPGQKRAVVIIATLLLLLFAMLGTWQPWNGAREQHTKPATSPRQNMAQPSERDPFLNHVGKSSAPPPQLLAGEMTARLSFPFFCEDIREARAAWAKHLGQPPEVTNSFGMKLVLIPPGSLSMGSPDDEPGRDPDEAVVAVTISGPFYLSIHEITDQAWSRVMSNHPGGDRANTLEESGLPKESVTWDEARIFCEKLTALEHQNDSLPKEWQYTLPTEAEWEYACRAGTTTPFSFGTWLNGTQGNCNGGQPYGTTVSGPNRESTINVGSFAPNAFGLFDMHGNVWEWCSDSFVESLSGGVDPVIKTDSVYKVNRGGSWYDNANCCRSAYRRGTKADERHGDLGFRLARRRIAK